MTRDRTETGSIEAGGVAWRLSARAGAILILLVTAAALGCRLLDAEMASTAALKMVSATFVVGIVPGALATLLFRPRPQLSVLEVLGFGIAISFGVVQLLTILAVSAHLSADVMLTVLLIGAALLAGGVIRRSSPTIVVSLDELIVLSLVLALGAFLYGVGAPVDSAEDQIHASIARRLSQLESPRLDNLYVAPGIVYTYPFPGTHYFMGLIARLGDIDALFVYHKIRFFWGFTVLVMLYLAARAVFGTRAIASAVAVTAVVLVCSGVFAFGFPSGWGHLVAYSHASDIAMSVLLPALLVVAFEYLQAGSTRARAFFFGATALLVVMLTLVHIREIVQFAAYLGCFVVVTAVFRVFRSYLRPAVALLALTLAVAAMYTGWQAQVLPLVDDIVDDQRAALMATAAASSFQELMFAPASALLSDFVQKFEQMFGGLLPFFLFSGPAVVLLFRRQPLIWLVSSSMVAYLAVMSVPLLAIPYIYLTYFEILHLPIRNIIFFVYMFPGALVYVTVVALARIDRTQISPVVVGAAGGALALLATLGLDRSHQGFFAPLIAAYGLTFVFLGADGYRKVTPRTVAAALVGMLALVALWPDHPPIPRSDQVTVRWSSGLPDAPRRALEQQFSLSSAEPKADRTDDVNAWNYRLTDLSVDNVRAIVTHTDVVDTHFIDRSAFTVLKQPPPGDHPPLGVKYVTWLQYPGLPLLLATTVLVWALALAVPAALASARGFQATGSLEAALRQPFYRSALPYALFMIPFVLWSARPALSPLTAAPMPPASRADTPKALIDQLPCMTTPQMQARFTAQLFPEDEVMLPERTVCPPEYALVTWVRTHVPVDAVFAIDRWDPYAASVFMPQQIVVFPTLEASFISEDRLFDDYYRFFYDRMRQHRVQPFFNSVETPAERDAFIKGLGVTHVLVNPAHYGELRPVLDRLPGQFVLRYDRAQWAVYEATGKAS